MQLLAITPIALSTDEITRRQQRYDRLSPAGVNVLVQNLGSGSEVPRSLESHEDIMASEECLKSRYRSADSSQFDGFLPDCVLDPVVGLAPGSFERPVYGILKLCTYFLLGQGLTVGAVARNQAIARELDRKLASYGCDNTADLTAVLGLSVDDITDQDLWATTTRELVAASGTGAVINGCSAVEVPADETKLVDPTALALQLLGFSAVLRLSPGVGARQ